MYNIIEKANPETLEESPATADTQVYETSTTSQVSSRVGKLQLMRKNKRTWRFGVTKKYGNQISLYQDIPSCVV